MAVADVTEQPAGSRQIAPQVEQPSLHFRASGNHAIDVGGLEHLQITDKALSLETEKKPDLESNQKDGDCPAHTDRKGFIQCLRRSWDFQSNFSSLWTRSTGTSASSRVQVLDGLRALSVVWVVSFHVMVHVVVLKLPFDVSNLITFWPAQPVFNGDTGVDVFFVLSGYLIGIILLKDLQKAAAHGIKGTAATIGTFIVRRWLRIFPMLLVTLIITIIGNVIATSSAQSARFAPGMECMSFSQVWPMLLFVNNYVGDFQCMIQTWSVAVEFQMYLISPLIIYGAYSFQRKRPRWGGYTFLFLLSTLNVGFNVLHLYWVQGGDVYLFLSHTVPFAPMSYLATWCRYSPYISGIAIALLRSDDRLKERILPAHPGLGRRVLLGCIDIACLAVIVALIFVGCGTNILVYTKSQPLAEFLSLCGRWIFGWCVAYAIFMCTNRRMRPLSFVLSLDFWYPLAVVSYGVYLLHIMFVAMLRGIDGFKAITPLQSMWVSWSVFTWDTIVVVSLCFCSSIILYMLIEKPFMNLRPKFKY